MNPFNSILILFFWIIFIILLAIFAKTNFPNRKELSRKVVHIGTGPIIPLALSIGVEKGVAIFISCLITSILMINHRMRIGGAIEDINRKSYGTIAYALSITILLWLFWPDNPYAITAGVLVMAFGDGIAGLIGPEIQSPSWIIFGQKKSIAGTLSMFLVSILVLLILSTVSTLNLHPLLILMLGILGTSLEQISPYGADNLTVPFGIAFGWTLSTHI